MGEEVEQGEFEEGLFDAEVVRLGGVFVAAQDVPCAFDEERVQNNRCGEVDRATNFGEAETNRKDSEQQGVDEDMLAGRGRR